jgi:outer membrane protein OmpA-like peptidoglycan-associated protein
MRLLLKTLLYSVLVSGAGAQWYGGYPPSPGYYYPPYGNPNAPVAYPPTLPYPPPVVVQQYLPPRQITYIIAFKDGATSLANSYWVSGNTLAYVTLEHQQSTVPLEHVDRVRSERLNFERNVPFYLPPEPGKAELRRLLEQQLNLVLETRNTSKGLVVRISDVLFQFNDYTLTLEAREKLARIAGILLAYSGLSPHLEGYTDDFGSHEYNLQLSTKRADAVRDYLISQGVPAANLTAAGLGSADPVTANTTAAGRQQNRRVEMLISGDAIGITVTSASLN